MKYFHLYNSIIIKLAFLLIVLYSIFYILYPNNITFAQSAKLEKAVENVKEKVDVLVEAKDEDNSNNNIGLRITALKKIIALSVSEASDLKIKLLAADSNKYDEATLNWRDNNIKNLNQIIAYYEKQSEILEAENENLSDLDTIKNWADKFKNWREQNYLALDTEIRNFLLINQENEALEITKKRAQKINEDILKLQKNKTKITGFAELMKKAMNAIKESENFHKKAQNLFYENYILTSVSSSTNTIIATTTATATTTTIISVEIITSTPPSITPTTTAITIETNATNTPPILPTESIRDLIRSSLSKIKETYQIFIEMSNLVRKLLK